MTHNQFRCSCGAEVVCGTGEMEYDTDLQELSRDHSLMGHDVLEAQKIPSNSIEAARWDGQEAEDR